MPPASAPDAWPPPGVPERCTQALERLEDVVGLYRDGTRGKKLLKVHRAAQAAVIGLRHATPFTVGGRVDGAPDFLSPGSAAFVRELGPRWVAAATGISHRTCVEAVAQRLRPAVPEEWLWLAPDAAAVDRLRAPKRGLSQTGGRRAGHYFLSDAGLQVFGALAAEILRLHPSPCRLLMGALGPVLPARVPAGRTLPASPGDPSVAVRCPCPEHANGDRNPSLVLLPPLGGRRLARCYASQANGLWTPGPTLGEVLVQFRVAGAARRHGASTPSDPAQRVGGPPGGSTARPADHRAEGITEEGALREVLRRAGVPRRGVHWPQVLYWSTKKNATATRFVRPSFEGRRDDPFLPVRDVAASRPAAGLFAVHREADRIAELGVVVPELGASLQDAATVERWLTECRRQRGAVWPEHEGAVCELLTPTAPRRWNRGRLGEVAAVSHLGIDVDLAMGLGGDGSEAEARGVRAAWQRAHELGQESAIFAALAELLDLDLDTEGALWGVRTSPVGIQVFLRLREAQGPLFLADRPGGNPVRDFCWELSCAVAEAVGGDPDRAALRASQLMRPPGWRVLSKDKHGPHRGQLYRARLVLP